MTHAPAEKPVTTRESVLDEAAALICGSRQIEYGPPEANFSRIAAIFNSITGRDLSAMEVGLFLTSVKLGRLAESPNKADTYVDAAGYIALSAEMAAIEYGGLK